MTVSRSHPAFIAIMVVAGTMGCCGCSGSKHDPSKSRARLANYAATKAYLRAREQFVRSAMADLGAGRKPMHAVIAGVREGCAGAMRGTPLENLTELSEAWRARRKGSAVGDHRLESFGEGELEAFADFVVELPEALRLAQRKAETVAVRRFARQVLALRWADARVTTLTHTFAHIELRRLRTRPVSVCRWVEAWKSSGYRRVPAVIQHPPEGTLGVEWLHAEAALGCGKLSDESGLTVLRALEHYGSPRWRSTAAQHVGSLESRLFIAELQAVNTRRLYETLGMGGLGHSRKVRRVSKISQSAALSLRPRCTGRREHV